MDHIERTHSIVLAGSIDRVFPLFTPLGEKHWVEGWDPEFLHPSNGEICEGMVFRTNHGGELALWACIYWNPYAHRVRYTRVTPGSRFGFVQVDCRGVDRKHTEATVDYSFTALSPEGQSYLAQMTDKAFAAMIDEWQISINHWLAAKDAKAPPCD